MSRKFISYIIVVFASFLFCNAHLHAQNKGLQKEVDSLKLEMRLNSIDHTSKIFIASYESKLEQYEKRIEIIQQQTERWISFVEMFFTVVGIILAAFAFYGFRQIKQYTDIARRDQKEVEKLLNESKDQQLAIKNKHEELQNYNPEEALSEKNKLAIEKTLIEIRKRIESSGLDNFKNLYQARAISTYDKKEWENCLRLCESYIDIDDNNADIWFRWARCKVEMKDTKKGLEGYTKAISIDPNFYKAYHNRGIVYSDLDMVDEAIADYTKSINIDSSQTRSLLNRGYLFLKKKNYDLAFADFEKAILIEPENASVYNGRGCVYLKLEDYEKAMADFNKGILLNPENPIIYWNRYVCFSRQSNLIMAKADLEKALEYDSENSEYLKALERISAFLPA